MRAPRGTAARVRFVFPPPSAMLEGERKERYLAGLWPHLAADRSGLGELPSPASPLDFLVFEDLGSRFTFGAEPAAGSYLRVWEQRGRVLRVEREK